MLLDKGIDVQDPNAFQLLKTLTLSSQNLEKDLQAIEIRYVHGIQEVNSYLASGVLEGDAGAMQDKTQVQHRAAKSDQTNHSIKSMAFLTGVKKLINRSFRNDNLNVKCETSLKL